MTKPQPLPQTTYTKLAEAGRNVRLAEAALVRRRNQLDSALYDAVRRGGYQVTAVADAAGVSRETVYKATGRSDPQMQLS